MNYPLSPWRMDSPVLSANMESVYLAKNVSFIALRQFRDNFLLSVKKQEDLPIYQIKNELLRAVNYNQIVIVVGDTGSGKSTQIPQYLAEAGFYSSGKIIGCSQPTKIAAKSIAERVSEELGCKLGEKVSYAVRFEDCYIQYKTIIKYMTHGILLTECSRDPDLNSYSVIFLDEAYERTINMDILFGLLKKIVYKRSDFRLILTCTTLKNANEISNFFNAPILKIPGQTFKVEIVYNPVPKKTNFLDFAIETVIKIHTEKKQGDILLFLPGQEEIEKAYGKLCDVIKKSPDFTQQIIIYLLYANLPLERQMKIFEPTPTGLRKVVIATNIAETSITIDGIIYVIDPGFMKQKTFNIKERLESFKKKRISKASAMQRAGRAGKTGPGKCFRLYSANNFKKMIPNQKPEIQRTNLANTVLKLKEMGVKDVMTFDFIDAPSDESLKMAIESLKSLDALDDLELLTPLGEKMTEIPLDPKLSKMLFISVDLECFDEIVTIVSMLSVQNVFNKPKDEKIVAKEKAELPMFPLFFYKQEGDHLTLLEVYNSWKEKNYSETWCQNHFLQFRFLENARLLKKRLTYSMKKFMDQKKITIIPARNKKEAIMRTICSAFFCNVGIRIDENCYRTFDNKEVLLHPRCVLKRFKYCEPTWVIYHELVKSSELFILQVSSINPDWIKEQAPTFYRKLESKQKAMIEKSLFKPYIIKED